MANELVQAITDDNFEDTISQGVILVDFWAEWCGPCKMQGPILEQLASNIGDKAKITKLNVDHSPKTAQKYNVMSIPTIIIYKNGEVAKQFVGVQNQDVLASAINEVA